ncbi:MAG: hypothetical protein KGD74_12785 [Candidatus Lokiarchaeota archaeon]|nr:hypothetical protein [Candidatus Lokiarchaeota archaeon]
MATWRPSIDACDRDGCVAMTTCYSHDVILADLKGDKFVIPNNKVDSELTLFRCLESLIKPYKT